MTFRNRVIVILIFNSSILAVEDGEMSKIGISITQPRDIYPTGFSTTKIKKVVLQHVLKPNFMKMSPSHRIKLLCLPAPFPSDTRSFIFHLSLWTIGRHIFQMVAKV